MLINKKTYKFATLQAKKRPSLCYYFIKACKLE